MEKLRDFAVNVGQSSTGSSSDIIKRLVDIPDIDPQIDTIKQQYVLRIKERRAVISDNDLIKELP